MSFTPKNSENEHTQLTIIIKVTGDGGLASRGYQTNGKTRRKQIYIQSRTTKLRELEFGTRPPAPRLGSSISSWGLMLGT